LEYGLELRNKLAKYASLRGDLDYDLALRMVGSKDEFKAFGKRVMKMFDLDESGALEYDEYINFCKGAAERFKLPFKKEKAEKSWKGADLNQDGKIDMSEL